MANIQVESVTAIDPSMSLNAARGITKTPVVNGSSIVDDHHQKTNPTADAIDDTAKGQIIPVNPVPKAEVGPITKIGMSEYKAAAATLAEAFEHDDVARYFLDMPDCDHWSAEKKWSLHSSIMEYITNAHVKCGLVHAISANNGGANGLGNLGSVALWMPPQAHLTLPSILTSGLWRLKYKLSPTGRKRFFSEFLPLLERTKDDILGARSNDSYYLVYIGTRAGSRGLGLAKRLIEEVTAKADREGKACYLESSAERNVKLYKRMGFEVRRRVWLGGEKVPLDIMVREPGGLLSMEAVDSGVSISPQTTRERIEEDKTVEGK